MVDGRASRLAAACTAMLYLAGCASAVDQFAPRVTATNQAIAAADVDNVVRNVVRAQLAEPLTFIAVSKVTDARNSDLKIGLPNVTVGPAQTAAQKQWVLSSNGTDNSSGYSLELAQLRTDTFTKGLLNPIEATQVENLNQQGFSRELLFYLLLDKIDIDVDGGTFKGHYSLKNDPSAEDASKCPYDENKAGIYNPAVSDATKCPFRAFQYMLGLALNYGVAVKAEPAKPKDAQSYKVALSITPSKEKTTVPGEAPAAPAPAAAGGAAAGNSDQADPAPTGSGGLCFNQDDMINPTDAPQGWQSDSCASGTSPKALTIGLFVTGGGSVPAHVAVSLRSPYAVFQYLGAVSRMPLEEQPILKILPSKYPSGDRHLFPLKGDGRGCFFKMSYSSYDYCVPSDAYDQKAAINVLILLLQMNTNRTDLPTSAVNVQL